MKEIGYALLAVLLMAGCGLDSGEKKTPAAEDIPAAQEIKVHEIPEASEALYHKAAQAYGKGHRTEALRLANQAINEDGENYKALSLKGIILAFDISPDGGIPFIEKALSISPSYVQADYDMAVAQKLGRNYDASIVHFQKVLKADPQNTWSYYGIATNLRIRRTGSRHWITWRKRFSLEDRMSFPRLLCRITLLSSVRMRSLREYCS